MAVNETPDRGDDGEILSKTRQLTNKDGFIKFEIELPSGRKVESEFFNPEFARKALLTWIATIKSEQESDKVAAVASAREKARELGILHRPKPKTDNPDAPLDEPAPSRLLTVTPQPKHSGLIIPATGSGALVPPKSGVVLEVESSTTTGRQSPDDFARTGLQLARKDVEYWRGVAQGATAEWQKAQREVDKWERMIAAMSGGVTINVEKPSPSLVVPSVPKRGRPRKHVRPPADTTDTRVSTDNSDKPTA